MTAWAGGTRLSKTAFAARFFGRPANDPVVEKLYDAVQTVASASSHAALADASRDVADAMQAIGLDGWPRFLTDMRARADEPETVAPVDPGSILPDQANDAKRPETASAGSGAAGAAAATGSGAG